MLFSVLFMFYPSHTPLSLHPCFSGSSCLSLITSGPTHVCLFSLSLSLALPLSSSSSPSLSLMSSLRHLSPLSPSPLSPSPLSPSPLSPSPLSPLI